MKRYFCFMAAVIVVSAFTGCKDKKNTGDIITKKPMIVVHRQIQKTGNYKQSRKVKWLGAAYTVEMTRSADASLPVIVDGDTKYYDNRITIRVLRSDGSEFFSRTFTKADFRPYIDKAYADGALVGIVLDRAEGDNLLFAASVGSPDKMSDEYVPLLMKLSRTGKITITKDTQLDTGSNGVSGRIHSEEEDI